MEDREDKPRVVEGIVLDRDGTPIATPNPSAKETQKPFAASLKLFKPSPLLVVGAVVAIPVILALLLFLGTFLLLMTLVTGKRPRIIKFTNIPGFTRR